MLKATEAYRWLQHKNTPKQNLNINVAHQHLNEFVDVDDESSQMLQRKNIKRSETVFFNNSK